MHATLRLDQCLRDKTSSICALPWGKARFRDQILAQSLRWGQRARTKVSAWWISRRIGRGQMYTQTWLLSGRIHWWPPAKLASQVVQREHRQGQPLINRQGHRKLQKAPDQSLPQEKERHLRPQSLLVLAESNMRRPPQRHLPWSSRISMNQVPARKHAVLSALPNVALLKLLRVFLIRFNARPPRMVKAVAQQRAERYWSLASSLHQAHDSHMSSQNKSWAKALARQPPETPKFGSQLWRITFSELNRSWAHLKKELPLIKLLWMFRKNIQNLTSTITNICSAPTISMVIWRAILSSPQAVLSRETRLSSRAWRVVRNRCWLKVDRTWKTKRMSKFRRRVLQKWHRKSLAGIQKLVRIFTKERNRNHNNDNRKSLKRVWRV